MKKLLIGLVLTCSNIVNAQQVNAETGNIIYTTLNPPPAGAPYNWTGFINSNTSGGGLSGGNVPAYNPNTGTFIFGYAQGTVSYSTAINFALANAGTGIQVNGFKYSWEYFNQDYSRGTLSGNISLTNNTGAVIQSYGYNMPKTTQGWTVMSGIQNFNTQYAPSTLGNLQVSFTGKDDRFWAGYYGPQIRAIDVRTLYSVAPPPIPDFSKWIKLTDENGTFTLTKSGTVRYGAQGTYEYKTFEPGTYSCSNGAWGKDPLGGVYKACDLGSNTPPPSSVPTTNNTLNATTTTTNSIIAAAAEPIVNAPTTTATTNTTTNTNTDSTPTTTASSSITSSPSSSPSSSTQTATSSSTTSSAAITTVTPVTVATAASSPSNTRTVDGTSVGLSVVARNQQREQSIAMQASQNAISAAEQTTQQVQQEALSVASQAVSNSFSVAQTAVKTTSGSNETKSTTNNTDLTSQSNQSSASVSLFSNPTMQSAQKQTDNNQNNLTSIAPTVTQQNTRTNQTNQQVESAVTDRTNLTTFNNTNTFINEIPVKPPAPITQAKTSDNTPVAITISTENYTQQTVYSLLPPVATTITQTSAIQSFKLVQDKEVAIIENNKSQEFSVASVVSNFNILPPRQETQQPVIQPSTTNTQNNLSFTPISQPTMSATSEFSMSDSQKMLLDRSSPLFQTLDNKVTEAQNNNISQQGPAVNRNAQNNEVAGGVDINRMAQAPTGYNEYLNLTLRDAAFYAPKEVYKNQRVIDNARVLRQLSSDRLHQQLVDSQYERK